MKTLVVSDMPNLIDLTGQKFGRLTVISRANNATSNKLTRWNCLCECGNEKVVYSGALVKGATQSCRCLANELTSQRCKKARTDTREYKSWHAMIRRCTNPNQKDYKRYGGRGITVCERWLESFDNFLQDMGQAPTPKHTLDRKENDGDYSPVNCRWATMKEQCNNRNTSRGKYKITLSPLGY